MRFFSKSAYEARTKCPRKYYFGYHYKGGFEGRKPSRDLLVGSWTHTGLEFLLRTESIEEAIIEQGKAILLDRVKHALYLEDDPIAFLQWEEDAALAEALVRGWYRTRYRDFLRDFEILSIEEKIETFLESDLVLVAKCDIVVRERATGLIYVWNWKTTNETKDWNQKWNYDIQMWTEAMAVEDKLGLEVTGCLVEGLYKGVLREGSWATPLLWAWKWLSPDGAPQYSDSRKTGKGWFKFPTWKEPFPAGAGLRNWIHAMDLEVLEGMFLRTNPIIKNNQVVEQWLRGIVKGESDTAHVLAEGSPQDCLDHFEMKVSFYNCKWCPFNGVCFGLTTIEDLVKAGQLVEAYHPSKEWNKKEKTDAEL